MSSLELCVDGEAMQCVATLWNGTCPCHASNYGTGYSINAYVQCGVQLHCWSLCSLSADFEGEKCYKK